MIENGKFRASSTLELTSSPPAGLRKDMHDLWLAICGHCHLFRLSGYSLLGVLCEQQLLTFKLEQFCQVTQAKCQVEYNILFFFGNISCSILCIVMLLDIHKKDPF